MTRQSGVSACGEQRWRVQFGQVGSRCPRYGQMLQELGKLARSHIALLLLGPTGTGKELLARAVHEASGRRGPFVAINCGALPEALVCSELFGHERGAFSGAERAAPGALRRSSGGTLFLDEVADAPLQVQVALLRALQDQTVCPVGSSRELPVNLRVVAATSRPLRSELQAGRFREDLYFRLAGQEFCLPPLRERRVDLPSLCEELLEELGHRGGLEPEALALLLEQRWPGNVRQLRHQLERAVVRAGTERPLRRQDVVNGSGVFPISTAPALSTALPTPDAFVDPTAPPREAAAPDAEEESEEWVRAALTPELKEAAAELHRTLEVPPAPAAAGSRRLARTWERALLLCLLCESERAALDPLLSRRVGRLFAAGWHLGEQGRSLRRLAQLLGLRKASERTRLVAAVEQRVRPEGLQHLG